MLNPNWTEVFPSSQAMEKELTGLCYKGEGWYFLDHDVALVVAAEKGFRVYIWNTTEDPRDAIQALLDLPKRAF